MKKITLFFMMILSTVSYSQTPITDANFKTAINTCLSTNPVDGLCSDSEYGAMPNWDVSDVTNMSQAFKDKTTFNGDISDWNVSSVTRTYRMFLEASSFNQDISSWDVSSVYIMGGVFDNAGLSRDNYDKLLNGWSQNRLKQNVSFGAVGINYCDGATGRQKLIDDFGWIITDGGLDCATASIEDQNQLEISLYPNPTNDKLFIQGLSSSSRVSIYNVLGKLVLSQTISKEIDVKQLSKGIYILKIIDEQKETVRKFIKD